MILTKTDLNKLGCSTPGCTCDNTMIFFHGRCHPHDDVQAVYDKSNGTVLITCATCEKPIAAVAVAAELPES